MSIEQRAKDIADAHQLAATADHYLVMAITTGNTLEELEAAEQLLIDRQNAVTDQQPDYDILERALDQIGKPHSDYEKGMMGFKLGDIVKLPDVLVNPFTCPTGKTPYRTKREAQAALKKINKTQRRNMRSFMCGYCDRYHLGHRRGQS